MFDPCNHTVLGFSLPLPPLLVGVVGLIIAFVIGARVIVPSIAGWKVLLVAFLAAAGFTFAAYVQFDIWPGWLHYTASTLLAFGASIGGARGYSVARASIAGLLAKPK